MTADLPKRLIEVDLPIKRISEHARREKSIRHGHISTLHIWWARRPLAACRAVICASLWPDPADPNCPDKFRAAARHWMAKWSSDYLKFLGRQSYDRFIGFQKDPSKLDDNENLRYALLDFIADFANWDNSTSQEYLQTSRALTQSAHEALGGALGTRPLVVDPFAGGGSIPLEALRVGADAFASDLNPIPVLLNKVALEYIPKYGQRLADEVRKWGEWIMCEAQKELAEFYPKDANGASTIAYLWARTIQCEGPTCGAEVPLIRSLWLAKRPNKSVSLQLIPNLKAKRIDLRIIVKRNEGWSDQANRQTVIENPRFDGTMKRGSVTCPCCGYTIPVRRVRVQLKANRGGTDCARLLAVVTGSADEVGRRYRLATDSDTLAVANAKLTLGRLANSGSAISVPFEKFSGLEPRRIPLPQYGMESFRDIYPPRGLLSLMSLCRLVKALHPKLRDTIDAGLADAVTTVLALAVDRQADKLSSLARWDNSRENPQGTFARQALPMVWDFSEVNPFSGSGGDWDSAVNWTAQVVEQEAKANLSVGLVGQCSATEQSLPNDSADALVTDPPYYYSVPYSDLSDYFYIWLKRSLSDVHVDLFKSEVTPKEQECVQNLPHSEVSHLQKDRNFYHGMMTKALADSRRVTKAGAIGMVVFAHSDTEAWEALLDALISAGWCVTASWPIDTEMANRVLANRQSTLASSVHLVCRPREYSGGSISADNIGDWRDVLAELPRRIHDWMPRLAEEGVVGADAIFACLGPALEIFSRYASVEKASGQRVALREYLEQVWAAVAREALAMVFKGADASGFEEDARLTAMWLWTLSSRLNDKSEPDKENSDEEEEADGSATLGGYALEYDAARKIAQGLGAHLESLASLVEVKGDVARLLPVSERTRKLFGKDEAESPTTIRKKKTSQLQLEFVAELEQAELAGSWGNKGAPTQGSTVLDRVHQCMILFAAGRGEALRRFLVDEGVGKDERFWRLAQVLSFLYPKTSEEKRWIDGVLARKKGLGF